MQKETKDIIKLTTKEILLTLTEPLAVLASGFLHKDRKAVIEINNYLEDRAIDRSDFFRKIYRLKKSGVIRRFSENKKDYIEITAKGKEKVKKIVLSEIKINSNQEWDGRWRVAIFDIPEKDRAIRDFFRFHLYNLGFKQVQKSVFVYPFECSKEINLICEQSGGRKYIKYMIADIIEGETDIIQHFLDQKVLRESDLKQTESQASTIK